MFEFTSDIYHWIEGFANSEWAVAVLAVVAFIESVFFPFPPDPFLIAASVFNPKMALALAGIVTIASVAGALVGYWLGDQYGRPFVRKFVSTRKVQQVEVLFQKYGVWAIVFAAVSPIPYKVFAITAGVMEMNLRPFIVASLIGRGARMFLWAGLAIFFGETALEILETKGLLVGATSGAAVIAAFLLYILYLRFRRREPDTG